MWVLRRILFSYLLFESFHIGHFVDIITLDSYIYSTDIMSLLQHRRL